MHIAISYELNSMLFYACASICAVDDLMYCLYLLTVMIYALCLWLFGLDLYLSTFLERWW
jgi:hypothetical protein